MIVLVVFVVVAAAAVALAGGVAWERRGAPGRREVRAARPESVRRILLPFTGASISRRAFDAAVRLAGAEGATLMPCYLATVPLNLPLEAALPAQCARAMPLLETIEQRASSQHVAIDARVARGRTYRDALRRMLDEERFDRVIVSATNNPGAGFSGDDLVWLLRRADAEVLILRPAPEDHREVAASVAGHF
ncbi:universal stress protein [Baekduia soli]|uniref:Universal stress protein n=1 Tax=Baekduia soli TaxID=496014 RepID=A0A5B8U8N5_9ACTN|nr:universal stress protein [Baekduia soli]QEC49345.1 universal stress protein [Baekduia soli]